MNKSFFDGTKKQTFHSDNITILRGIACLYIFFCHFLAWENYVGNESIVWNVFCILTKITQPKGETNIGVILFVVLSGYCIHRNNSLKNGIVSFYLKRFIRVYPVFFIATFLGIVLMLLSHNYELTCTLTESKIYYINFKSVFLRITGLNVFFSTLLFLYIFWECCTMHYSSRDVLVHLLPNNNSTR